MNIFSPNSRNLFFPVSRWLWASSLYCRLQRFSSPCLQVPFQWLITSGTAVSGVLFLILGWKKPLKTIPLVLQAQNQPLTYALQTGEASKMISQLLNGFNYFCLFFFPIPINFLEPTPPSLILPLEKEAENQSLWESEAFHSKLLSPPRRNWNMFPNRGLGNFSLNCKNVNYSCWRQSMREKWEE